MCSARIVGYVLTVAGAAVAAVTAMLYFADPAAEVVDVVRFRHEPVDPEGVDLGDAAEDDLEPALLGLGHERIVVVEVEGARLRLDPAPDGPELERVEPRVAHAREVVAPVAALGERRAVVLGAEDHGSPFRGSGCALYTPGRGARQGGFRGGLGDQALKSAVQYLREGRTSPNSRVEATQGDMR